MNRSSVFVIAFLVTTFPLLAQTTSGNMMVGGGFRFHSDTYQNGNDVNTTTFSPGFGYFISDRFALGTTLTISGTRTGTGQNKTIATSFGLGPFARYYIFTSNENFGFFGQAQLVFSGGKVDPPGGNISRNRSVSFAISPGAAYFFNEHWAMELTLVGLRVTSTDPDTDNDNDKNNTIELGLNSLQPALGVRYHF